VSRRGRRPGEGIDVPPRAPVHRLKWARRIVFGIAPDAMKREWSISHAALKALGYPPSLNTKRSLPRAWRGCCGGHAHPTITATARTAARPCHHHDHGHERIAAATMPIITTITNNRCSSPYWNTAKRTECLKNAGGILRHSDLYTTVLADNAVHRQESLDFCSGGRRRVEGVP
jgi:hypothetical protein